MAPTAGKEDVIVVGPWGGPGGKPGYKFQPDGKIIRITVRFGREDDTCIHAIKFGYLRPDSPDHEVSSDWFGGEDDNIHHLEESMYIEAGEYIIEMSGTFDFYFDIMVITSLSFKTNRNNTPKTFGYPRGTDFSLPVEPDTGKFVGFHGGCGNFLDSIGALLALNK